MDHTALIRADASALIAAARSAGLDAPTPSCPGWTVQTLVGHIGLVHHFAAETLRLGGENPWDAGLAPVDTPQDEAILDWFAGTTGRLLERIASTEPGAPAWNWSREPHLAAFWPRRMAHETAVHRWDAERAAGDPAPIAADVAVDGIDEVLDVFLPVRLAPDADLHGTLHLHATDADGEWLVGIEGGAISTRREHAKGDAAVRGTASDLNLFLWGRLDASALELHGDTSVVERWRAVAAPG